MPRIMSASIEQIANRSAKSASGSSKRSITKLSVTGDSRTVDLYLTRRRKGGRSWPAWANAYMFQSMEFVACYAISSKRSDEFLAEANFVPLLTDGSTAVLIGYPAINDLSQAVGGYTDVDGNVVTLANAVDLIIKRLRDRVARLVASGKDVGLALEPGGQGLAAGSVAAVHELNARMKAEFASAYRVYLYDPTPLIWDAGTTNAAIVFKPGFTVDNTHATSRQGQVVGKDAAVNFFPRFAIQRKSYGVDLRTSSAQLFPNAGYAALTGGTVANMTGSDPVPANVALSASAAGLASYTLTSAPTDDGGNEITLNVTATGAVQVRVIHQGIPTAGLGYTDSYVSGLDVNVLSASGCRVYWETQIFTTQGTEDGFDLYGGDGADIWMVNGATGPLRMQSDPTQPPPGSSSGIAPSGRLILDFKAAGGCQVKFKDPTFYRK